jgi:hypothetical protein
MPDAASNAEDTGGAGDALPSYCEFCCKKLIPDDLGKYFGQKHFLLQYLLQWNLQLQQGTQGVQIRLQVKK